MQQISRLQWQFAGNLHHRDAAVDRIYVHYSHRSGDGRHSVDKFFVGVDHDNCRMPHATVIGGGNQFAHTALGHLINFFQKYFGFRGRGVAHDESNGLAVGPAIGLPLANLDHIGERQRADGVRLVGNEGEISRRSQRNAGQQKKRNDYCATIEQSFPLTGHTWPSPDSPAISSTTQRQRRPCTFGWTPFSEGRESIRLNSHAFSITGCWVRAFSRWFLLESCSAEAPVPRRGSSGKHRPKRRLCPASVVFQSGICQIPERE